MKKIQIKYERKKNTKLDNEISLVLSSPIVPKVWSENKENFNNDPFKTNVG